MSGRHARAAVIADRLEAELVRLGRWSKVPIDPARLVDMGAFGQKTLAAEEWIQFVLLSRLREIVAANGELPATSEVAVWATREFDGDLDAGPLIALLGELDELIEGPEGGGGLEALLAAAKQGDARALDRILDRGVDPQARGEHGLTALHVAAAGGHAALPALLANPLQVDVSTIVRATSDGGFATVAERLLATGFEVDARTVPTEMTPLMLAVYFGQREVAAVLRSHGADESARDYLGRSAERLGVFQIVARVIELCRRLPMVASAYVAQIHAPVTHQYTTPVLGLELTGALPGDAFAAWPADHPIVAFVLAEDAVSRLVRLAPPVYTRPVIPPGRTLADAIAGGVGGSVLDVPGDGKSYAVALADGRVPVLVRELGHAVRVCISGVKSWYQRGDSQDAAMLPDVIATTQAWATGHAEVATIYEIALAASTALGEAIDEPFDVSIPGTPDPTEMWLRPRDPESASVGIFDGRVVVSVDGARRDIQIGSRSELADSRTTIIAAVREQLALAVRNRAISERIRGLVTTLAGELAKRLETPCVASDNDRVTHEAAIVATITGSISGSPAADDARELVRIVSERGVIRGHAGLVGAAGWDGDESQLRSDVDGIVAAILRQRATLTLDRLVVGRRYRVLETIQELPKGEIVFFEGFDDIDNHHGCYDFRTAGGKAVRVCGDFSTPDNTALGETHRYLEPVDG